MNTAGKIVIVVTLIAAAAVGVAIRMNRSGGQQLPEEYLPENLTGKGIPALIDIGAETCIPCKLMAPILEELKEELQGRIMVQFLNLDTYPGLAKEYQISIKPTQIFYDASGQELFRHEGFYSKEDILSKWQELGVDLTQTK